MTDDRQCEYPFVESWSDWPQCGPRRCLKDWSALVFDRRVCHLHADCIATPVFFCTECHRVCPGWERIENEDVCQACARRIWPSGEGHPRCDYCGAPMRRRFYSHCGARLCRLVDAFWHAYKPAVGYARMDRDRCWNELVGQYAVAEFLKRMAHPKSPRELEFAKRYRGSRPRRARGE